MIQRSNHFFVTFIHCARCLLKTSSIWLATTRSVLLVILGPTKMSCCDKVSHSLSWNRRLRATSPTSEATWRRRWTASRSSPPSEDTMRPTLCLGLGGTYTNFYCRGHKNLNKWYKAYAIAINTRYYGSKEDYDKDAQTKYDNSRRYRDPISINDRWIKFANFAALRHLYLSLT